MREAVMAFGMLRVGFITWKTAQSYGINPELSSSWRSQRESTFFQIIRHSCHFRRMARSLRTLHSMNYQRLFFLFLCMFLGSASLRGQGFTAEAYFLHFSLDAQRHPVLCQQIDSATATPYAYGVHYDATGRPASVSRLFFGNIYTGGTWAIMKFRYDTLQSGSTVIFRTWHDPSGLPIQIGIAYGETALYDSTGFLLMYTATDQKGERVEEVNAVTRSMFRKREGNMALQEWRYSNNKQYPGLEEDFWNWQFSPLGHNAWFRLFLLDEQGFLKEEQPLDLAQRPTTFPDGIYRKVYDRNACGLVSSVTYYDLDRKPMVDSSGISGIDYDYDEEGRLVEWRAYDQGGNPKGRKELHGAARMTCEYRQFDGKLLSRRFYDEKGEELELSVDSNSSDS